MQTAQLTTTNQDFDRWADHDQAEAEKESAVSKGRDLGLPVWVVETGFTEYVQACRHFAEYGDWPNGCEPQRPPRARLQAWQRNWISKQVDRMPKQYPSNKPRKPKRINIADVSEETRDQWIEAGRKLGLPSFVCGNGLTEYVLHMRYIAEHGVRPERPRPAYPEGIVLSVFQWNWIKYQKDPKKFAEWLAKLDDRSAVKKQQRAAECALKPRDVDLLPFADMSKYHAEDDDRDEIIAIKDRPALPTTRTSLAEFMLSRKKARSA